jgi:virginiamycin A acetyltransferase
VRSPPAFGFCCPAPTNADLGPSTFPFGVFGPPWDDTMDIVMSAPSRGDTVIGHDVWLGYSALVLPGVTIGHGAVVAIVAGNPARVVRPRFEEEDIERLLRIAWWNWPIELITEHARTIMSGTPLELERIAAQRGVGEAMS